MAESLFKLRLILTKITFLLWSWTNRPREIFLDFSWESFSKKVDSEKNSSPFCLVNFCVFSYFHSKLQTIGWKNSHIFLHIAKITDLQQSLKLQRWLLKHKLKLPVMVILKSQWRRGKKKRQFIFQIFSYCHVKIWISKVDFIQVGIFLSHASFISKL